MPAHPQRLIGRTGVSVYPIGLGAMPLSLAGRPDEATALQVIKAALGCGVNLIDTANSYCRDDKEVGHNERLIAASLKKLGATDGVHVATKGGLIRPRGAWHVEGRPDRLKAACEQSLRDLDVETIFLYQLHAPDPNVPYAESVGALAELQQAGKIRHVGLSNVDTAELAKAQSICRVESVQNRCNPTDPDDFRNGVIDACARDDVTYIAYSPVGGHFGHKSMARQRVLGTVGQAHGVSAYQVMLAWLLAKGEHILPIPGASKVRSITDSAAAANLTLSPDDIARIDALGR